jgi:hypothetical protein
MVALLSGVPLVLIGAFYTIGLLPKLGWTPVMVDVIGLFVLGLAPLALGLVAIWYGKQRLTQMKRAVATQQHAVMAQHILRAAQSHPQGMTLEAYMSQTSFSASDVKAMLEKLYLDGQLELDVTEQGQLVYKPKAFS